MQQIKTLQRPHEKAHRAIEQAFTATSLWPLAATLHIADSDSQSGAQKSL
jgi:hypothetical protein